jgi:hypothetical protein
MMELLFLPGVRASVRGSRWMGRAPGRWVRLSILASTLLALSACNPFGATAAVETCVVAAMRHGEPYGNEKERTETEAQLRHFCGVAAARKGM